MSRFLRFCVLIGTVLFASSAFAGDYTCPSYKKYTSCSAGYYLSGTTAGNSCEPCEAGYKCTGTTAAPVQCTGTTYQDETGQSTCKNVSAGYYRSSATAQAQCPSGYRDGAAASSQTNCTASCSAGTAVFSYQGACTTLSQSTLGNGWYMPAHTVKYGTVSPLNICQTGFNNPSDTAANHASAAKCQQSVSGKRFRPFMGGVSGIRFRYSGYATVLTATSPSVTSSLPLAEFSVRDSSGAVIAPANSYIYGVDSSGNVGSSVGANTNWVDGSVSTGTAVSATGAAIKYDAISAYQILIAPRVTRAKFFDVEIAVVRNNAWVPVAQIDELIVVNGITVTIDLGEVYNCGSGTYKGTTTYDLADSATSCSSCSALAGGFYPNSPAGSDSAQDCKTDSISGAYVASANATSATPCDAGTYKAAHTVAYGSTSSCSTCSGRTKYSSSGAASCSTVSSGYYTTGCNSSSNACTGQSQCTGATYCSSGVQNDCPSGYTANTTAGKTAATSCQISVSAKNYIKTANDSTATSCGTGTYKAAHTVNYGSTSTCSACTNAPANSTYTGSAASDACPWSCNSGYGQNYANNCIALCSAGFGTLHTSTGVSVPLYATAVTTPAIHIKAANGTMCYGNLQSGSATGAINVKHSGTTYHSVQ